MNKLSIEIMQKLAIERGGKCLSNEYKDAFSKLKWQCKFGHEWYARPCSVKRGHWCAQCAKCKLGTIEEMQKLAVDRGGVCLSGEYKNSHTKIEWKCHKGHVWFAKPYLVKNQKSWCPCCKGLNRISESICRQYFEAFFQKKFPKIRPNWLVGKNGRSLELDGYCEELKLAFEYQGEQHYNDNLNEFFKNRTLVEQQMADACKSDICKTRNIVLVKIPYTVSYKSMGKYIFNECVSAGINIHPYDLDKVDYRKFDYCSIEKLNRIRDIACDRGGICLSFVYIDNRTRGFARFLHPAHNLNNLPVKSLSASLLNPSFLRPNAQGRARGDDFASVNSIFFDNFL